MIWEKKRPINRVGCSIVIYVAHPQVNRFIQAGAKLGKNLGGGKAKI